MNDPASWPTKGRSSRYGATSASSTPYADKPAYDPPNLNPPDAEFLMFYDTETTGLPLYHDPSDDPRQPHMVQVAAKLVHVPTRAVVDYFEVVVRPDGWVIPDEVAAIHGITNEYALEAGIAESAAVQLLVDMWLRAQGKVAFNESFDRRIVRIAIMRHVDRELADKWKAAPFQDPCFVATDIMRLESTDRMKATGRGAKPKKPKLSEAVEFFTGRPLDGAHNAMNDVDGCMAVYFAIEDGVRERVVLASTPADAGAEVL